jgi:hypothetical protein
VRRIDGLKETIVRSTLKQLQAKGVLPYTRQHVDRLVKAGKIPAPKKAYPGGRLNTWDDAEFEALRVARAEDDRELEQAAQSAARDTA